MGSTGVGVSRFCLGTMTFGHETDEQGAFDQLDAFVEAGGNFVDTADVYNRGVSEEIIGRWLAARAGRADEVVLATKGRFATGGHPNSVGLSRKHLTVALDASLRRLGVERIDLYQVHAFDPLTPLEETLRFFDDALSAGKISYFGLSNFLGWQVAAISELAASSGRVAPVMLQPQYSLLARFVELEIVPACVEYGLGLIPWSPLGGGWLTGKYTREQRPTGATRLGENPARGMEAYEGRRADQQVWDVLDAVREAAEQTGHTMAQVSLAWVADRPAVVAPILGNRTIEQLREALAAADLHLDADLSHRLDGVSRPHVPPYPYGVAGIAQRSRPIDGGG